MLSMETFLLSKRYTNEQIKDIEAVAIDEAVTEAVAISKRYTDEQVAVASWNIEFVNVLPPLEEVDMHTIYFVPMTATEEDDHYYEYIYTRDNGWELIGSTEFKPDNYMTKQEVMDYVNEHQYILIPATEDALGGVKIDTSSINLDMDGKISISSIKTNDIANLFN